VIVTVLVCPFLFRISLFFAPNKNGSRLFISCFSCKVCKRKQDMFSKQGGSEDLYKPSDLGRPRSGEDDSDEQEEYVPDVPKGPYSSFNSAYKVASEAYVPLPSVELGPAMAAALNFGKNSATSTLTSTSLPVSINSSSSSATPTPSATSAQSAASSMHKSSQEREHRDGYDRDRAHDPRDQRDQREHRDGYDRDRAHDPRDQRDHRDGYDRDRNRDRDRAGRDHPYRKNNHHQQQQQKNARRYPLSHELGLMRNIFTDPVKPLLKKLVYEKNGPNSCCLCYRLGHVTSECQNIQLRLQLTQEYIQTLLDLSSRDWDEELSAFAMQKRYGPGNAGVGGRVTDNDHTRTTSNVGGGGTRPAYFAD
jgi:hypothetical protein